MGISIQEILDRKDLDSLKQSVEASPLPIPTMVKGRIAEIDGDYLAYIVSADRKDQEPTTMAQAKKHLHEFLDQLLTYSGSEAYRIHLTEGGKGGRYDQAKLKEYQANRNHKEKPLLLGEIRQYMATELNTFVCTDAEADDSMAQALYLARLCGTEDKAVLISQDKDLNMVQGLHMDWMTCELYTVDALGKLELEITHKPEKTNEAGKVVKAHDVKKLRGTGGLWFFAQLLTGDTADNISGLPRIAGSILNDIKPTQPITKAKAVLEDPKTTEKQKEKAIATLDARPFGQCGGVTTYEYLKDCTTLLQAFQKVIKAYALYASEVGFEDYNGKPIGLIEAFQSECRLLYMRHNRLPDDFAEYLNWIKEGKLDVK